MRNFKYLLILFISIPVYAARDVQFAECLPQGVDWPVRVVYLHGLFKASGADTNGFRALESNNRASLEQIAAMLRVRIAIPVSSSLTASGMRHWNGRSLASIEAAATAACGQAPSPARALVGFSNGAYRTQALARKPCAEFAEYSKLIAIGAPRVNVGGCKKLDQVPRHEFPPRVGEYDLVSRLAEIF